MNIQLYGTISFFRLQNIYIMVPILLIIASSQTVSWWHVNCPNPEPTKSIKGAQEERIEQNIKKKKKVKS